MPSDPARAAKVQAWLTKVAADLRAAEHDLAADPPLLEDSLFHCQQAAEKTLKAFLTSRNISFRTERADIEVIWFGSWPKGTAKPHADVDIAIAGAEAFPPERLAELRALTDNVATLHEIDLVDLHTVGEAFRHEILRHGIRL